MLPVGQKIGPYEIVRPIGAGGMGEVYCAKDPRLSRLVAIKLLPSHFSENAEPLRRFRKEAEAIASLNHPNILTVHDIGVQDGIPYFVTELLQGETLRQYLSKGKQDLSKVAELAFQLANGLAAAHEKGITHRDLKPENLFITKEGRLKILDFGLAKLAEKQIPATEITEAPTASAMTEAGVVLGTVAYMSPEQVRAVPVDHRSDIFSFGSVLYEMLTGRRPFTKDSNVETMNAILHEQPVFSSELDESVPGLVRIVKRCLEKESDHRFQSAMDIAFALEAISGSKIFSAPTVRSKPNKYAAASALLIIVIAGIVLFMHNQSSQTAPSPMILGFEQLTNQPGEETRGNISPDGKNFVYSEFNEHDGNWDIYLQRVGGRNPINLTHWCEQDDNDPAYSPDGEQIAFRSSCEGGGIFVMGATGESVKRISEFGANHAWTYDRKKIAYSSSIIETPRIQRA
ncbi:serine/threonine-protein kinase, partial [bacterium]|nr:serine/threonine-protein kinase [bacterium]